MHRKVYSRPERFLSVFFFCAVVFFTQRSASAQAGDSVVSLSLQEAIELGVRNSNKLKSANLAVEVGIESVKQKKTDRLPDINLALNGFLINDPILYTEPVLQEPERIDYTPYQVSGTLTASQVIYAGSRIKNSIDQQVLQKNITEFAAAKNSADVKLTIIREYLRLYTLVKDYQLHAKTINQIELRLKTLRSKFQNGQVVKNDVSRSELQKSDFELKLVSTINHASASNYFLTRLLGLSENTIIQVDTAYTYTADTVFVFDESLQVAFNNRPEYQIARTNKKLSENTLSLVKGAYYPTVTGVGIYGLQNPVPGTFPPQGNFLSYLTIGLGVNYNLATFYKTRHQKLSANLAIQREVENIKDLEIALSDEVKTQLLQYEIQRQSLAIYAKKIRFAEDNYKIVKSRYYNDLALISDMVDAELEYNQALLDLLKGQVQTRLSYYQMMKVIGKL